MSEKRYIGGSAKAISTQYGEIMNLSLKLEDMQEIANEKGYVNMSVMKRREPGQFGDTHYVVENSYKPQERSEGGNESSAGSDEASAMDVPF